MDTKKDAIALDRLDAILDKNNFGHTQRVGNNFFRVRWSGGSGPDMCNYVYVKHSGCEYDKKLMLGLMVTRSEPIPCNATMIGGYIPLFGVEGDEEHIENAIQQLIKVVCWNIPLRLTVLNPNDNRKIGEVCISLKNYIQSLEKSCLNGSIQGFVEVNHREGIKQFIQGVMGIDEDEEVLIYISSESCDEKYNTNVVTVIDNNN